MGLDVGVVCFYDSIEKLFGLMWMGMGGSGKGCSTFSIWSESDDLSPKGTFTFNQVSFPLSDRDRPEKVSCTRTRTDIAKKAKAESLLFRSSTGLRAVLSATNIISEYIIIKFFFCHCLFPHVPVCCTLSKTNKRRQHGCTYFPTLSFMVMFTMSHMLRPKVGVGLREM